MNRQRWRRVPPVIGVALAGALLGGCVDAAALTPTLTAQRAALDRIAASYAADLDTLQAQLGTTAATLRTQTLGRLHRELIASGQITPALAGDDAALDKSLADPASGSALAGEVRAGRMTRVDAADFLHDYALAMQMSREGPAVRTGMLARLQEVQTLDAATQRLTSAMAEHAADVKKLLDDAGAATGTLDVFAEAPPPVSEQGIKDALSALWGSITGAKKPATNGD